MHCRQPAAIHLAYLHFTNVHSYAIARSNERTGGASLVLASKGTGRNQCFKVSPQHREQVLEDTYPVAPVEEGVVDPLDPLITGRLLT
jgi:hypothetical protein